MNIVVNLPVTEEDKAAYEAIAPSCTFHYTDPKSMTKEDVENADIAIGNIPLSLLPYAKNLKWQQLNSAGTDGYTVPGALPEGCFLTNASGAYGLAISEHMLAYILCLYKKLNLYLDNQSQCFWRDEGPVRSIEGATVLIVGLGDIGGSLARKIKLLGAKVWGIRRVARDKPEYLDEVFTLDQLDELLPKADIVACSLPGTPQTKGLFDARRLSLMKKDALFINVGRGTVVDTDALCQALHSGNLGGAAVDVTDPEPLPSDHPLWKEKNCIITPHISGFYHLHQTLERIIAISQRNLKHFLAGEPLENQVDFSTGYRKL